MTVKIISFFLLILFLPFCAPFIHAEIYVYVDKKGVYHYTNAPTSSKFKPFAAADISLKKTSERKVYQAKNTYDRPKTDTYSKPSSNYGTLYISIKGDEKGSYNINSQTGNAYKSKNQTIYYTNSGSYIYASQKTPSIDKNYDFWNNPKNIFVSPSKYEKFIRTASFNFRLDPSLIKAVIHAESAGKHNAVSPKGALGLMQLMPGTAKDMDVSNPLDPEDNIFGGSRYLKEMLDRFDGDVKLALAAYNAGPGAVEKNNGIPPYQETQQYVKKVISLWKQYKETPNTLN